MGPCTGNRLRAATVYLPGEQERSFRRFSDTGQRAAGGATPANVLEHRRTLRAKRWRWGGEMTQPFLSVSLTVKYGKHASVLNNVFLQMRQGEVLGLIGQSGSGKSTLALSILRLLELKGGKASGSIFLQGRDLMALSEREMRSLRGRDIGLVLQSPLSSLNPALR